MDLIPGTLSRLWGLGVPLYVALWSSLLSEDTSLEAGNVIVKALREYYIHEKYRAGFSAAELVAGLMVEYICRGPRKDVKALSCLHWIGTSLLDAKNWTTLFVKMGYAESGILQVDLLASQYLSPSSDENCHESHEET